MSDRKINDSLEVSRDALRGDVGGNTYSPHSEADGPRFSTFEIREIKALKGNSLHCIIYSLNFIMLIFKVRFLGWLKQVERPNMRYGEIEQSVHPELL